MSGRDCDVLLRKCSGGTEEGDLRIKRRATEELIVQVLPGCNLTPTIISAEQSSKCGFNASNTSSKTSES